MKAIKGRIKSVKSTQQITKAMNLVATSKLSRSREKLKKERLYSEQMRLIMARIAQDTDLTMMHPCFAESTGKNNLIILITADRGLCGGYNTNACRAGNEVVGKSDKVEFICVGGKGREYYARRGRTVLKTFFGISETPFMEDAQEIAEMALNAYNAGTYDNVYLVYTHFHTVVSYEPKHVRLLPFDASELPDYPNDIPAEHMSFEPNGNELIELAVQNYIEAVIFNALCESASAQLASKMVSMETATENAEKMISSLALTYNRARQARITQELTEIVAGANALT